MYVLRKIGIIFSFFARVTFGYDNLALSKSTWQSSSYDGNHPASAAVDGDRTSTFRSSSCALAAPSKSNTWRVDLGEIYSIFRIDIFHRNEVDQYDIFMGRFAGYFLYVSNTTDKDGGYLCFHNIDLPTQNMTTECIIHGRYVINYNERKSGDPSYYSEYVFNELCEVEVYGCSIPRYFGENCSIACPKNCQESHCDIVNGTCLSCVYGYKGSECDQPCEDYFYGAQCAMKCGNCRSRATCNYVTGVCQNGCAAGWKGEKCDENLTFRQPAWQSSNYDINHTASAAVDGDRTSTFRSASCAVAAALKSNTWRVDLGKVFSIFRIDIYYRNEVDEWDTFMGRFAGFFLYLSNTTNKDDGYLCFHNTAPPTPIMTIRCVNHARYVIYYNERKAGDPNYYSEYVYNELCEVEVYGCASQGFYGNDCNMTCPDNCKKNYCDIVNGICLSCVDGYQGTLCDVSCDDFFYGENCTENCGYCLNEEKCDPVNGLCEAGCAAGWQGYYCKTVCEPRTFGLGCMQRCNSNCISNTSRVCDYVTGKCDSGCIPGWKGDRCDKKCDGKMFGQACHKTCGACLNFTRCHHIDGTCVSGCDRGFYGDTCSQPCGHTYYGENCLLNCSSDCDNITCDAVTGACISHPITQRNYAIVITGGATGGVIGICVLVVVCVFIFRRHKTKTENQYEDQVHYEEPDKDTTYTTISTNPSLNIYEEMPEKKLEQLKGKMIQNIRVRHNIIIKL